MSTSNDRAPTPNDRPVVVDRRVQPWVTRPDSGRRITDRVPYADAWGDAR